MKKLNSKVNTDKVDLINNALDISRNALDAGYEFASVLLVNNIEAGAMAGHLEHVRKTISHPLIPSFFFLFKGLSLTGTSLYNIYAYYQEDKKNDEKLRLTQRYHNTLIAVGIFAAHLALFTGSVLCTFLVPGLLLKTGLIGAFTIAMITMDIAIEGQNQFQTLRAIKELEAKIARLNVQIDLQCTSNHKMNAIYDSRDESTCEFISSTASLIQKKISLENDLRLLNESRQFKHYYLITSALGLLALVCTAIPVFIPTALTVAALMSAIAITLSLTATYLDIKSTLVMRKNQAHHQEDAALIDKTHRPDNPIQKVVDNAKSSSIKVSQKEPLLPQARSVTGRERLDTARHALIHSGIFGRPAPQSSEANPSAPSGTLSISS